MRSTRAHGDLSRTRRWVCLAIFGVVCVVLARGPAAAHAAGKVDFNREVRPLLSDNCFACHGPDEKQRKAGLRLDVREEALKPAKSGEKAIVPGDVAASALVARLKTTDEDEKMPPAKTGKHLTPAQIALLERWVAEGAEYTGHWSFTPPARPEPPSVDVSAGKVRNDIDRFVLAALGAGGRNLKQAPEADRRTLIRRLSYDLTGLPPAPADVEAFVADKSPDAYERLVDRLLVSPRYGEHMTRFWLDAARYADTHGYHIDSARSLWKYRDWLIDAFNDNMPFDQFTIEQLAGDQLPNATTAQKIASGYVRSNMSTGEGGAIEEEYQAKYGFDRVETTGTIWMGLTLVCARCHTHKYDPITQKEYYSLFGFFNNLKEDIMDGNKPNPDPFIKLPTAEQARRLEELQRHIGDARKYLDRSDAALDAAQTAWATQLHRELASAWASLAPGRVESTNGVKFQVQSDGAVVVAAGSAQPEKDTHELIIPLEPGKLAAFKLETIPQPGAPGDAAGRGEGGRFLLTGIEAELRTLPDPAEGGQGAQGGRGASDVKDDKDAKSGKDGVAVEKAKEPKKLKIVDAATDSAEDQAEAEKAFDDREDTGWAVASSERNRPHAAVFALGELAAVGERTELVVRLHFRGAGKGETLAGYRLSGLRDEVLGKRLLPGKPLPWHVIGPFPGSADLPATLGKSYPPEERVDLEAKYPGVRDEIKWNTKSDWQDGSAHQLVSELHGVHGVYYLHRKMEVAQATEVEVAFRADDLFKVWLNGQVLLERLVPQRPGEDWLTARASLRAGTNEFLVKVVNLQGECTFAFARQDMEEDPVPGRAWVAIAASPQPAGPDRAELRSLYRRRTVADDRVRYAALQRWKAQEQALDAAIVTTLVAKEADKPRDTMVLMRGEYDKHGERVPPGVPAVLGTFGEAAPTNRIGFARWLVHPQHPLTARVTVNRLWQQLFGVGLVKTLEDFGLQGEHPSHPELLDWLATEFVRSGWNVKHLLALMVTSATYRQSSAFGEDATHADPENRQLARGPRFRLDAESIRDTALAVGGLLVERNGGRSVRPYEPPGLWEAVSFNNSQKYVPELGEGRYRRSVYTHWKRQSPPPAMLLLDAPTREYCVVRRPRTNTPLQALALMNDPQYVEAAQAFAARILTEGGRRSRDRVRFAFRAVLARDPAEDEARVVLGVLERQLNEYRADPAAAERFFATRGSGATETARLDRVEWAAWSTVASMLLNLDEALTKG